jgi:4'-phosphopantetheinyl transferase
MISRNNIKAPATSMTKKTRECFALTPTTVDVWLISLDDVDAEIRATCRAWLSESELRQWQRFVLQTPADLFLISRCLLRHALSWYAPVPEDAWQFARSGYGRPYVAAPSAYRDLRFNLSHTSGLVALALRKGGAIGIDVENTTREIDVRGLAERFFAPAETKAVMASGPVQQQERFFAYWTLKEAYIKARGMGLSLPLESFWFELEPPPPQLRCTPRCDDQPEGWWFGHFRPTPFHWAALAVASPVGTKPAVRVRQGKPVVAREPIWTTPVESLFSANGPGG